jgi:hypothetical protein
MTVKVTDSKGSKAEIEVTEFKSLQEAYKVILDLVKQVENLKQRIKELKDGNS